MRAPDASKKIRKATYTADSLKKIYLKERQQRLNVFKRNDSNELIMPAPSILPDYATSSRFDTFRKKIIKLSNNSNLKLLSKNNQPYSFIWESTSEKIKEGVRWGIVKSESLTGKAIAALGNYRLIAQERIARGLISNSHFEKIGMIELCQRQLEALQELEGLVNKPNFSTDFVDAIKAYKNKLDDIKADLKNIFKDTLFLEMNGAIKAMEDNITDDQKRADQYLKRIIDKKVSAKTCSYPTGNDSILTFVKRRARRTLYEAKGYNQDLTNTIDRNKAKFQDKVIKGAVSRGEFNSCVVDALKEVRDYNVDLRNAILPEHHGLHGKPGEVICYDFQQFHLSPEAERRALLAIPAIEGRDKVICEKDKDGKKSFKIQRIDSASKVAAERKLKTIAATGHTTTRTSWDSFGRFWHSLTRMFKSFIFPTRPWEGYPWATRKKADNFRLWGSEWRGKFAKKYEPLWKKPYHLCALVWSNIVDVAKGVRDVGANLSVNLPAELTHDWDSTDKLDWKTKRDEIDEDIRNIIKTENNRRDLLCSQINDRLRSKFPDNPQFLFKNEDLIAEADKKFPRLAGFQYELAGLESNDLLTSFARGLNQFANVITHNIYAKQPVPALIFTVVYILGGLAILTPELIKALGPEFADGILKFYNTIAPALGKSPLTQAGSTCMSTAQLSTAVLESVLNGPNSWLAKAMDEFCNDPATAIAYVAAAYGLGYVMTNGIGPLKVDFITEFFKEEMGSAPSVSYPFLGGKIGILFIEFFASHKEFFLNSAPFEKQKQAITKLKKEIIKLYKENTEKGDDVAAGRVVSRIMNQAIPRAMEFIQTVRPEKIISDFEKIKLTTWLAHHRDHLPKLGPRQKSVIIRAINSTFPYKEAASLRRLVYPEKPRSIAYQFFAIPLSYIPAILRVVVSPVISFAAICAGRYGKGYDPGAPIRNSFGDLMRKCARDLSRLIVFGQEVSNMILNTTAALITMPLEIIGMMISRVGGLFGCRTSSALYKAVAAVHSVISKIVEFFNPRFLKNVAIAHPSHTINNIKTSYDTMLALLPKNKADQLDNLMAHTPKTPTAAKRPANDIAVNVTEPQSQGNAAPKRR